MQERLTAGEFHNRRFGIAFSLSGDFVLDGGERHCFTAGEGISGVAVGAAKVATGEAHEDTRPPGESAFALEAEINFMDAQCTAHTSHYGENGASFQSLLEKRQAGG